MKITNYILQNPDNFAYGRIEAEFFSLFFRTGRSHGLDTTIVLPISDVQMIHLGQMFDPKLVILANLAESYKFVRNFVLQCNEGQW